MNERALSQRLEELANLLEGDHGIEGTIEEVVKELRKLSNENYAPGNSQTWADIKPKGGKKSFTQGNRKMPF